MKMLNRISIVLCAIAGAVALPLHAQIAQQSTTLVDPWVPPALRKPATTAPSQGTELRAQVERKLKANFDAAAVNTGGSLTQAQASAAGLGYVAKHFGEIDQNKAGAVRFEDVKQYMQKRGAQFN
jgi:hypothetical protein